jgi:hypothetical protein
MSEFEKEQDPFLKRPPIEGAELGFENKGAKEAEAEKKMGAKERMETVSKEVKTTKNQIQNIVANMQQVIRAVALIRAELELAGDSDIPAVKEDEHQLDELKKKLAGLNSEVDDLKIALLQEEQKAVKEEYSDWNEEAVLVEAQRRTARVIKKLEVEE